LTYSIYSGHAEERYINIWMKACYAIHIVTSSLFGKWKINVKYRTNKQQHPRQFSQHSSTVAKDEQLQTGFKTTLEIEQLKQNQ
jgi:hypothetical protein